MIAQSVDFATQSTLLAHPTHRKNPTHNSPNKGILHVTKTLVYILPKTTKFLARDYYLL